MGTGCAKPKEERKKDEESNPNLNQLTRPCLILKKLQEKVGLVVSGRLLKRKDAKFLL